MEIVRTLSDLRRIRSEMTGTVALVPTMGALHDGHMALLADARRRADHVVASIFVNPLQFDAAQDLNRYPRPEAEDLARLGQAGCDLAWLPGVDAMYPGGEGTTVAPAPVAALWEGQARPGHFRGVATVVAILFNQVRPHFAVFGEKDWQQLQVVRALVRDLAMPIGIVGVPIVREANGLALSSRNRFLTPDQQRVAPMLHDAMRRTSAAIAAGLPAAPAIGEGSARLATHGFDVEYYALTDAETLRAITARPEAGLRLIAAARLGNVRLLDNLAID